MNEHDRDPDFNDPGHQDTEPTKAIARKTMEVGKATGIDLLKEYLPQNINTNVGALSAVLGFMSLAWSAYHIRKFSKYLEDLAFELDCDDPGALTQLLELHGEEAWFAENLDRGFRQMMEATDHIARKCILLLVAAYAKRREHPDREYRIFGSYFAQADAEILRFTLSIADCFAKLSTVDSDEEAVVAQLTQKISPQVLLHQVFRIYEGSALNVQLVPVPGNGALKLRSACDSLVQSGLLAAWTGDLPKHEQYKTHFIAIWARASPPQVEQMKRLLVYLEPVRGLLTHDALDGQGQPQGAQ
ncbi:hypothetical protein [Nannocystis punicea]|uniref:Uncharacterized protein n=1 Tax=Nannocystis punicea TaxID=2995304 RepID=A0ABY7HCE6_9BACT|nr:hypothetical protein [Nannocystis poenicansa]WAS96669.1 hypothetical protein O0S08_11005 [Nannocystis poenicansa]